MTRYEGIQTRASLLERLKDMGDQSSWNSFYDIYYDLIFSVARRAGLNESEAAEVVQETLISVAAKMPDFTYSPAKDSFRGWLLTVTRWRVRDQYAKRSRQFEVQVEQDTHTSIVNRVPDPTGPPLEAIWEQEWESQLLEAALARIKRQVKPQHYQIYHLHVVLGRPARDVARTLAVNSAQIYLAKHRVSNLLKKEVQRLRQQLL